MSEKSGTKVIKVVSVCLLIFVVLFQLYQSFYNPVTTGTVIHYSTYNGIELKTVAIRDESLLTTDSSGILSYNVDDGGKIEKGGVVAEIYKKRIGRRH